MPTLDEVKNKVIEVWESDHIILPSVTAAQFILESASGTSVLAKVTNNLFGIKASAPWSGEVYYHDTNEEVDHTLKPVTDGFRKYAKWQDSVQDHSDFFVSTETRKKIYAKIIGETDYTKVCSALTETYATDSSYGKKLIAIIEANGLDAWDQEGGSIMGRKIFIDDGHGGADNGATSNGILEDAWNLEVCAIVEYELIALGHQVMSTRSTDIYVGLSERAIMANNWGAEIFISCHVNAGGGAGYEDFIYNSLLPTDTDTPRLQDCIHAAVTEVTNNYGLKNRGQKTANYAVLRETYMPAILLEAGFLDNASDASILKNNQFKKEYARAIVVGIQKYFGLSATAPKPAPTPAPSVISGLAVGTKVTVRSAATHYQTGQPIASWVKGSTYTIKQIKAVNQSASKRAYLLDGINSWLLEQDVITPAVDVPAPAEKSFTVQVTTDALNVRTGPGTGYNIATVIRDRGVYTITSTNGDWGKLKSGSGWISLAFTKRI